MQFWLGTHEPSWLNWVGVPLFLSHRRLARLVHKLPRAIEPWALDSGGFTELSTYGEWRTTPEEYVDAIAEYAERIGNLEWCAPQDMMCEPHMLKLTGLTVAEHQRRTIENYLRLRSLSPAAPVIPVLQGWELPDYLDHLRQYAAAGVDLLEEPLVGVGTVCRRQHTDEAHELIERLAELGLRLHGFGLKMTAAAGVADLLASSDSMAWSYNARRNDRMASCTHRAKNCSNCPAWALAWRDRLLEKAAEPRDFRQIRLPYQ